MNVSILQNNINNINSTNSILANHSIIKSNNNKLSNLDVIPLSSKIHYKKVKVSKKDNFLIETQKNSENNNNSQIRCITKEYLNNSFNNINSNDEDELFKEKKILMFDKDRPGNGLWCRATRQKEIQSKEENKEEVIYNNKSSQSELINASSDILDIKDRTIEMLKVKLTEQTRQIQTAIINKNELQFEVNRLSNTLSTKNEHLANLEYKLSMHDKEKGFLREKISELTSLCDSFKNELCGKIQENKNLNLLCEQEKQSKIKLESDYKTLEKEMKVLQDNHTSINENIKINLEKKFETYKKNLDKEYGMYKGEGASNFVKGVFSKETLIRIEIEDLKEKNLTLEKDKIKLNEIIKYKNDKINLMFDSMKSMDSIIKELSRNYYDKNILLQSRNLQLHNYKEMYNKVMNENNKEQENINFNKLKDNEISEILINSNYLKGMCDKCEYTCMNCGKAFKYKEEESSPYKKIAVNQTKQMERKESVGIRNNKIIKLNKISINKQQIHNSMTDNTINKYNNYGFLRNINLDKNGASNNNHVIEIKKQIDLPKIRNMPLLNSINRTIELSTKDEYNHK